MALTIKQAAAITGISADTLRYYDNENIISPKRSEGGYRIYDDDDIRQLKNLVVMKYAHFSLAEMKRIEEMYYSTSGVSCNEISKGILTEKISELRQTISNYQKIIILIEEILPMIDSVENYEANKDRINGFIEQIFEDIRSNRTTPQNPVNLFERNGG